MKVGSEEHLLALTKATLLLLDLESDRLMRGRAQLEAGEPAIRQRISQAPDSVDRMIAELRAVMENRPR